MDWLRRSNLGQTGGVCKEQGGGISSHQAAEPSGEGMSRKVVG